MQTALKITAALFAFFHFLGYGWWERTDWSPIESAFWLSPALALLTVAVLPFRLLASNIFFKWGTGVLCAIGILRLAQAMIGDWNSPIEPNTPAIALRAFSLGILLSSLYLILRLATAPDRTSRE